MVHTPVTFPAPVTPLEAWKSLDSPAGADLLARCAQLDLRHPASIESLRRDFEASLVAAAVELTLARQAAADKFGPAAARLWCDRAGVEMASSPEAAAHKARRFADLEPRLPIHDLCCGIGADAMAFVSAGLDVHAVDLDPVRTWMCRHNAGCRTEVSDVADITDLQAFHIDPQRRNAPGRRIPRLEDLEPGLDVVRRLIDRSKAGCIKLFPGVPFDQLPPGQIEILSQRGRLRQALLWTGRLGDVSHLRAATVLDANATITGHPGPAPIAPMGHFVHAVDPAVERAELIGQLAHQTRLTTPHPASGLLTGDQRVDSPFLRPYRLLEEMPWSLSKVRRRLRDFDAGIVTIKTRGRAVDPDQIQSQLRGSGTRPLTLFIQRFGSRFTCLVCEAPEGLGFSGDPDAA